MDSISFAPVLDLPLACITLACFLWYFHWWVAQGDIDSSIDVSPRLPAARVRLTVLLVGTLTLCWIFNLAFWLIFAVLFAIGFAFTLFAGGEIAVSGIGFIAVAFVIREWAFGFPQLILHPEPQETSPVERITETTTLHGKTGVTKSPLRPAGDIEIGGIIYSAASADGRLIDTGTTVTVTECRNGRPLVVPTTETPNG